VLLDEHADVIREAARAVAAELMELEVSELIGAERGERRPPDRATHRNGYRARRWDTRAGEVELQIPKIRQGSYFPSSWSRAGAPSRRCWLDLRIDRPRAAFGEPLTPDSSRRAASRSADHRRPGRRPSARRVRASGSTRIADATVADHASRTPSLGFVHEQP
jgi:hypothetical protein